MSDNFSVNLEDDFVSTDFENVTPWDGVARRASAGDHLFEVDKAERKPAKNGKPMLTVQVVVVGDANGNSSEEDGRRVFANYLEVGDKAKQRLLNFLRATDAAEGNGYRVSALKGKRFFATVTHKSGTYVDQNGETKESVNVNISNERHV